MTRARAHQKESRSLTRGLRSSRHERAGIKPDGARVETQKIEDDTPRSRSAIKTSFKAM